MGRSISLCQKIARGRAADPTLRKLNRRSYWTIPDYWSGRRIAVRTAITAPSTGGAPSTAWEPTPPARARSRGSRRRPASPSGARPRRPKTCTSPCHTVRPSCFSCTGTDSSHVASSPCRWRIASTRAGRPAGSMGGAYVNVVFLTCRTTPSASGAMRRTSSADTSTTNPHPRQKCAPGVISSSTGKTSDAPQPIGSRPGDRDLSPSGTKLATRDDAVEWSRIAKSSHYRLPLTSAKARSGSASGSYASASQLLACRANSEAREQCRHHEKFRIVDVTRPPRITAAMGAWISFPGSPAAIDERHERERRGEPRS